MYEQAVIQLMQAQAVFVATINGTAPQVRPMRARIDEFGVLWLHCSACRRADEIAVNDQAALCAMDEAGSVLRMNGRLEPVPARMSVDETMGKMAAYRFRIHSVLFNPVSGGAYLQFESPQDLDGILLQPHSTLSLQRR